MKQKALAFLLVLTVVLSTGFWFKKQIQIQTAEAAPQTATTILDGDSFNGAVNTIAVDGNVAYVGGAFSSVGKESGSAAAVSTTTGLFVSGELAINNTVNAVASDGSGGWYIAGDFTSVGGQTRNYLAYIDSSGDVNAIWNPDPDDVVRNIVVSGSDIFVSGDFTTIGGQSRAGLAKLNNTNGNADGTWNPDPDDSVSDLAVSGSSIYVVGHFTNIGGALRNFAAKLNNTNGNADGTWDPNPNDWVESVAVSGSNIYVGGSFFVDQDFPSPSIGGEELSYTAKLNNTDGAADTSYNPAPDQAVGGVEVLGSYVYILGSFGVGATQNLARFSLADGTMDTTWVPAPNATTNSIGLSGSDLYVAGYFTSVGGQSRTGLAKLNNTNGNADSVFNANTGTVSSLAIYSTSIFAGGTFTSIGGLPRNGLAAINLTTNELTNWNPNVSGEVNTIAISGSDVYVGGEFSTIGGQSRANLAKVDIDTGAVDATWNPSANDVVYVLTISGSDIYVAGQFNNVGGLARNAVAKLNNTNGNADALFSMNAYFTVFSSASTLDTLDSYLYIASTTAVTINLVQYRSVYRANRITGEIDTTWIGGCSACGGADAYFVKVISPYIYVSGNFASYQAGAPSGRLVRLNLDGSIDETWSPTSDNRAYAVSVSGSDIFVGGAFDAIGGQSRSRLAKLNNTDGSADLVWNPTTGNNVLDIEIYESSVLVSGSFSGGIKRYNFPTISLTSTNSFVAESIGTANIPLSLSVASDLATTVSYAVTSGNTIGGGTDYTLASGTATIPISETSANISVAIVDDSEAEGPEHLTVTLSNPGGALLGASNVYTLNINDNDHGGGSYSGGGGGGGAIPAPPAPAPVIPVVPVGANSLGTNIKDSAGTVYTITEENGVTVRRPYTSWGAFMSYGFNSAASIVDANNADILLSVGSFVPPQDGSIICSDRAPDQGTCYLMTNGQRAGFVSEAVFLGQGFSFANTQNGDVSFLLNTTPISSATARHLPGTLVNNQGTYQIVGNNELLGFPSEAIFVSWGYDFAKAVLVNTADTGLTQTSVVSVRSPRQVRMEY